MRLISNDDIAIIGYAFELPKEINTNDKLWEVLEGGRDVIEEIPKDRWDWKKIYDKDPNAEGKAYAHHGAFLKNIDKFDPNTFRITPIESHNIDPQQRLVLKTVWRALENGFLPINKLKHSNTGVFIGATMDDYLQLQTRIGHGENINRYTHFGSTLNNISGRVSFVYGFHGPSVTIDTACSSSLVALDSAIKAIKDGDCDIALAGGVNVILTEELYIKFSRTQMLSKTGKCRTFDNSADGYVRGEGCGILVIQKVGRAKAEGKRILAVIRGSSVNHNGNSSGLTVPSGKAQEELITSCMKKADVSIDEIDYIEAHGTGTQLGDKIEVNALQNIFKGRKRNPLLIGSVKTNLGHLESAAGVAGIIKVLLSMEKNIIPRSININEKNKNINWDDKLIQVAQENIQWATDNKIAGISSFGASGTNAHIILQKYEVQQLQNGENQEMALAISAKNNDSLIRLSTKILSYLEGKKEDEIRAICRINNISRSQYQCRIAVYATSKQELLSKLRKEISEYRISDKVNSFEIETAYRFNNNINIKSYIRLYDICNKYKLLVHKLLEEMECNDNLAKLINENENLLQFILEVAFFRYMFTIGLKKRNIVGDSITKLKILFAKSKLARNELIQIRDILLAGESIFQFVKQKQNEQCEYFNSEDEIKKASETVVIDMDKIDSFYGLLLESAVEEFLAGSAINWELLYDSVDVSYECLPNYEFDEQKYWIADQQHLVENIIGPRVLEKFINSISYSNNDGCKWIFEINNNSILVNGHVIDKTKVLVGTCQVQLVKAFLDYIAPLDNDLVIKNWFFINKIEIADIVKVQIELLKEENQIRQGSIACWNVETNDWDIKTSFSVEHNHNQVVDEIYDETPKEGSLIEIGMFYDNLSAAGLHLDENYKIIDNIMYTDKRIYADIKETNLEAAILDAASQLLYIFNKNKDERELFVPYYFDLFTAYDKFSMVKHVEAEIIEQSNGGISGNIYYYDDSRIIAKYEGYHLKRIQDSSDVQLEDVIGKCMQLPNGEKIYTYDVRVIGTSLNDHAVYNRLTIPGAYYISQVMYLAQKKCETNKYTLSDINFYNAVVLDEHTKIKEVVVVEEKENNAEIMISSGINNSNEYLLNAKIHLNYSGDYENVVEIPHLDQEYDHFYIKDILRVQRKCGLHLGKTFNWLQEAWIKDNMVQAIIYNSNSDNLCHKYGIPPGAIDTAVQVLGLSKNNQIKEEGAYIPLNIGQIISYCKLEESMWCVSTIIRESGNIIIGDVVYYNKDKTVKIIEFKEMSLIKADQQKLGNVIHDEKMLFTESWNPISEVIGELDLDKRTILELRYGIVSNKTILNVYEYSKDGYVQNEKLVLEWMDEDKLIHILETYSLNQKSTILVLSDSGAFKMDNAIRVDDVRNMVQNITEYYFTVLKILQNINITEWHVYSVTNSAFNIISEDRQENMIGRVIWGLVRSIQEEATSFNMTIVDIDKKWLDVFDKIEVCAKSGNTQIGLRNNQFYIPKVSAVQNYLNNYDDIIIDAKKTYVVVGGFGALGYKTCEFLVKEGAKKLLVIGQSEFGEKQSKCKKAIEDAADVKVKYCQLDVSNIEAEVQFREILVNSETIGGIIFAAGIVIDKYHANYKREDIDSVYASKINGTFMLSKVLKEVNVDFCICYSSIVSAIGSSGQSVYGAANSFQDFMCDYMRQSGINMFTIQWGPWGQVGMFSKVNQRGVERYKKRNIFVLTPEQALLGLKIAMHLKKNTIVSNMTIKAARKPAAKRVEIKTDFNTNNSDESTVDKVKIILASCIGIKDKASIDESKLFLDMGIDSLMAVEIRSKINKEFKINLPLELFFDNMNINSIVQTINKKNVDDDEVITGEI